MKKLTLIIAIVLVATASLQAKPHRQQVNRQWQATLLAAIDSFPQFGGYYTGGKPTADYPTTAWQGLHNAFVMSATDSRPYFDCHKAQPSFCSIATYAVLVKALTMWDCKGKISRQAWRNMKPCVGIADELNTQGVGQDDGVGFWGRANANGPSMGVLIHELKAGFSMSAYRGAKSEKNREFAGERYMTDDEWRNDPIWSKMLPGDILKIFWDKNNREKPSDSGAIVGYNGVKGEDQEAGHSVIFTGFSPDGKVRYWSSNGPGKDPKTLGYKHAECDKTDIQRLVVTRILHPERFDNVRFMPITDVNQYLWDLNGVRHSTTAEVKAQIGEKP
ncbi:MAG: hypothetical protein II677_00725 [Muribaculaceae bacterium]|nr:hypothetical protein [Muribaculaceae bacterium]